MATVAQLIKRAMRPWLSSGESPTTDEYSDALETLNGMLASWSAGQGIYAPSQQTKSLSSGTSSLTVGASGDLTSTRPKRIDSAYLRDTNNNDYQLNIESITDYSRLLYKATNGLPEVVYVRKGHPNWTLYFDYSTDQEYTLILELMQPLSVYAATTETVSLPTEYEDAIVYNLAVRLSPEHTNLSPIVIGLADETLQTLENINMHPVPKTSTDRIRGGGRSNIFIG